MQHRTFGVSGIVCAWLLQWPLRVRQRRRDPRLEVSGVLGRGDPVSMAERAFRWSTLDARTRSILLAGSLLDLPLVAVRGPPSA